MLYFYLSVFLSLYVSVSLALAPIISIYFSQIHLFLLFFSLSTTHYLPSFQGRVQDPGGDRDSPGALRVPRQGCLRQGGCTPGVGGAEGCTSGVRRNALRENLPGQKLSLYQG